MNSKYIKTKLKINKSSGKKILNATFYPDQKGINKFIKGKSELKGNKQVKTKNLEFVRKFPKCGCDDQKVVRSFKLL